MKQIINNVTAILIFSLILLACKKEINQTVKGDGIAPVVTLSKSALVLSAATATDTVLSISWTKADFDFKAAMNYTVELVNAENTFSSAVSISTGANNRLSFLGSQLNEMAIGLGLAQGSAGAINIRIKTFLSDSVFIYSLVSKLTITTYQVEFPALLVRGGNSWVTPSTRTKGYVLTSPNYDSKYEGYVYFPNADGWGGDGLKLQVQSTGVQYGWGGSQTTMTAGSAGNLWFTPSPNYMKVNADINTGTVNFEPVQFFLSGNHNGWSTSATPMTYNASTHQWVATSVTFNAGDVFVFTSNGNYNISYKVNNDGKLIYAGPPTWAGNNIPVPGAGTYTVILDMSGGNGSYTFKIQ
ncbi:SusE domain-containing protein [Lacibacter sp.]|uniref:SusE domain-containing protein n=1 Tax=Lacibacter sp. TaxID=1915409 RepID=UPI002B4ACCBC|nr:SusE domain-containing protein [Lacibacter sp.]HLP35478.1 SusE domain-containing protein [Lacibacter sp.]